jgi:2-phosphoglycerate kinase
VNHNKREYFLFFLLLFVRLKREQEKKVCYFSFFQEKRKITDLYCSSKNQINFQVKNVLNVQESIDKFIKDEVKS